jgi:hypothetical protein
MKFEIMNNEDGSWKEVMDGKAEKVK